MAEATDKSAVKTTQGEEWFH